MRAIWLILRIQESFLEEVTLKLSLEEWEKMRKVEKDEIGGPDGESITYKGEKAARINQV